MIQDEKAYEDLGLSINASRQQVEKRYLNVVRRLHAKEMSGTLSMLDEIQLKSVNQAYRFILNTEINKLIEEYRVKHYGKYKRFSQAAEKVDHFLYYNKFQLVGCIVLLLFTMFFVTGYRHLKQEQSVSANLPVPDLSIMVAVDDMLNQDYSSEHSLEQQLLPLLPEWKHIESTHQTMKHNSLLALLTENPDLYILDRDQFIKLLRLGYLRKIDEWDSYGVDLSNGSLPGMLKFYGKPLIAAVSVNSEHPEKAIHFIHRLYDDTKIKLEANKVLGRLD